MKQVGSTGDVVLLKPGTHVLIYFNFLKIKLGFR
jgi:hypothetical protein